MPRMGFELTVPVFERAKTFHAVDPAATVIDSLHNLLIQNDIVPLIIRSFKLHFLPDFCACSLHDEAYVHNSKG
jgi:hypothetical protein